MNTSTTYLPIETNFMFKGFLHSQVKRDGDFAIYKKSAKQNAIHLKDYEAGYEVVKVLRHDGYTLGLKTYEPSEYYPSNEMWGKNGFTCTNIDDAEKILNRMKNSDITPIMNTENTNTVATVKPVTIKTTSNTKLVFPETKKWTIKNLMDINPTFNQVSIGIEVRALVEANRLAIVGKIKPAGRGRPSNVYSVIA